MAIMNAFGIPIEEVNRVLDVQFNMVRLGVGTYAEFQTALGRAIPAAVAAGQSVETLAGMMAFLTRNGLSTEMAATSAARAMELFSSPDKFGKLEALGITVRNSAGEFLQMNDIVSQLANNKGWASMAEPQRKEMFKEIFGTGTIQARRFFDIAIPGYESLNTLTGEMQNSAGAMDSAYNVMFEQPASKIQLMNNQLAILKVTIWDSLRPAVEAVAGVFAKLLGVWNSLSPETQRYIVIGFAVVSMLLILIGAITAVIGIFMIMSATLAMVGLTIGGLVAIIAGVIVVIALLAAAAYLIYENWGTIKEVAADVWGFVRDIVMDVWENYLLPFFNWIADTAPMVWQTLVDAVMTAWDAIVSTIQTAVDIIQTVIAALITAWDAVTNFFRTNTAIQDVVMTLGHLFTELGEIWAATVETISFWVNIFIEVFQGGFNLLTSILLPIWETTWNTVVVVLEGVFAIIYDIVNFFVSFFALQWNLIYIIVSNAVGFVVDVIMAAWPPLWEIIKLGWDLVVVKIRVAWETMIALINAAIDIISGVIKLFLAVLRGDWDAAWEAIKQIVKGVWDAIVAIIMGAVDLIRGIIGAFMDHIWAIISSGFEAVVAVFQLAFWRIVGAVSEGVGEIVTWFRQLPSMALDALGDIGSLLYNAGRAVIDGLWNGMKDVWDNVTGWLSNLNPANWFNDINVQKGHAEINLVPMGLKVMKGLQSGMATGWDNVSRWLSDINPADSLNLFPEGAPLVGGFGYEGGGTGGGGGGINIAEGAFQLNIMGNVDKGVLPEIQKAIDAQFTELTKMIIAGSKKGV